MKFREGKTIDRFFVRKNGKDIEIILRYPKKSDVREVWKFYNKVIKETEFLSRIKPVTLKEEKTWVKSKIKSMRKGDSVQLLAECGDRIIGSSGVDRRPEQRMPHAGRFGIAILQEFTGLGIGRRMMAAIERESKHIGLRILELSVFGGNKIAQKFYKKMGFKKVGKIPRAIKIRKGFDDEIIMYKVLKK